MFNVDNDIPAPEKREIANKGMTDFIRSLDIGESFTMPKDHSSRSGLYQIAKNLDYKIATKKEDEFNIRVWRVE